MANHIKTFRTFESVTGGLTYNQESWLNGCIDPSVGAWSLDAGGLVNVEGNFHCAHRNLSDFKGIKFGVIEGNFECNGNKLSSLEGAPREVKGDFKCYYNNLTSLEGAPERVEGNFTCYNNFLGSLKGAPQKLGGYFWCSNSPLTSLEGAPRKVGGDFYCGNNNLASLEGAPLEVEGDFYCINNPLTSLSGAPLKIEGRFEFSAGKGEREFSVPEGQWGTRGWLRAWETIGDPKAKALILTLLDPDVLNKLFRDRPEQTMIDLQGVWNVPEFAPIRKQLKVPERYRDDMDLLGDMKELGF